MIKRLLVIVCAGSLLAGCVSSNIPAPPPKLPAAHVKLKESGHSMNRSTLEIQGIQKTAHPNPSKPLISASINGMNYLSSIDWVGPIGPLVAQVAQASNYRYRVLGPAPAIPIIITIRKQNIPLAEILRDADFQAGAGADIKINKRKRIIELHYHPQ